MSSEKLQKKKGGQTCCVVGCNSRYLKGVKLSFYGFPNKPWEQERRKKWIASVRRRSTTGSIWSPTKSSKICSAHFEGGCKSENPRENSYHPTIFPDIYKKKQPANFNRGERLKMRKKKKQNPVQVEENAEFQGGDSTFNFIVENILTKADVSIQTDANFVPANKNKSIIFCWQDISSRDVSTQCNITIDNSVNTTKKTIVVGPKIIKTHTVKVGPDQPYQPGFVGFADMSSDLIMKRFTGNNVAVFKILLKFVSPGEHGQPKYFKTLNAENRLLLFLMKMKLGLDFGILGTLFHVSLQTASAIFRSVLKSIYKNTKTWVFWPSREAIKATMSQAFRNYPKCRGIMDCAEIRCETPPTVEQRVLMYSSYKSGYTVKFLVVISPSGMITLISRGYGGRSTDGFIVNDSGFINLVEPGDEIMADKGFPLITTELLHRDCVLVMPPFANNPQFTREEVLERYSIASVRIHVERAIQRIKVFKILQYITHDLLDDIDEILHVACALANCKEPIIPSE